MTRDPNFDELVGAEPMGSERERLRRAHELLLQAGPPPELPPELAAGPQLEPPPALRIRQIRRRAVLVLAAALLAAGVFGIGYGVGHRGGGPAAAAVLALKGTAAAPQARATLDVLPAQAGNWPMKLAVEGLPKLPPHAQYAVFLVRKGERYLSCGTFVTPGGSGTVTVTLNAPYALRAGDTWIVTRQAQHGSGPGATVLRPA